MKRQREPRTQKQYPRFNTKTHTNVSESLCHEALLLARKLRELDFFIAAQHSDALDAAHIDVLLGWKKKLVPIQIKSCYKAAKKHKRRWPLIPCHIVLESFPRTHIHSLKTELLAIFHSQPQSCELILDDHTISVIRERIRIEGYWELSPFYVK